MALTLSTFILLGSTTQERLIAMYLYIHFVRVINTRRTYSNVSVNFSKAGNIKPPFQHAKFMDYPKNLVCTGKKSTTFVNGTTTEDESSTSLLICLWFKFSFLRQTTMTTQVKR